MIHELQMARADWFYQQPGEDTCPFISATQHFFSKSFLVADTIGGFAQHTSNSLQAMFLLLQKAEGSKLTFPHSLAVRDGHATQPMRCKWTSARDTSPLSSAFCWDVDMMVGTVVDTL